MKKLIISCFILFITSCVHEPCIEPEQEPFVNIELEKCDTFTYTLTI